MKKITLFLALLTGLAVFSQNRVAQKVTELQSQNTDFKKFSVLEASFKTPGKEIARVVNDASFAIIKEASVNEIVSKKHNAIELQIPYHNEMVTLQLYRVNLLAEGFHVDTDKQKNITYEPGVYYRGIVKGDGYSLVSFNFFKGELNGIVSSSKLSNLTIGKLDKKGNKSDYILFEDQKMNVTHDFECSTDDKVEEFKSMPTTTASPASNKCVTVYFEIDNNLYQSNGSNTTTTSNWMTSVFNNVQTLYTNDGITTALKSVYIWTTQDPYEGVGTSSGDYLAKFNQVRPVFDGDVGQLVGIDPGGLGGVAVTIGGLCTANNYCYSDVNFSYSSVPTYSWTVQVVTHELGHLLGSRHTHACVWNGNNTAIDNCAPSVLGANSEGYNCMTNPPTIPSGSVKGTIMSYCHLVGGVGISFTNGFGPQPAAAILNHVDSRTCLGTDCISTCINMVSEINSIMNAGNASATITWSDSGSATSWQINVYPFTGSPGQYTTVNTNSYNATGLTANTYYKVRIRPVCGFGMTALPRDFIMLTGADYCNGIQLTDTGGIFGQYGNNQTFVRTLIPNLANNRVKLTFTTFKLEDGYDFLYIYDGSSTASPLVGGAGLTGATIPAPIESTAADGALTMKFVSDAGVTDNGWVATTSCIPSLGLDEASYVDFSYYPNPVNGAVNIVSKDAISEIQVFNVQGQLLYANQLNDLTTKVDMSAYATGTYFFKMKINNQTVNFKVVKL
ncbi:M12 family metallo-peptidase [Flavobacterium cerinum]|uniref:M12 family metallo-peptidase n=1 Tax=Flavobacterium cerinum TaxID=2502784 RepID=A0ABY5IXQ8_9FLAO|nr:M12 family metallo-peptidase [Flavobacterium cerinum]UUC46129.1 M12 family metallo-peptidase [Flavobacterium cerinum]